jgi:hypothetical protein
MTEEETRAIAYQDQFAKRAAFRAQMERLLLAPPANYIGLYARTKAMIGEVPQDDGQDNEREREQQNRAIANL